MATQSYAQKISEATVMVAGIQAHAAALAKRGITAAFTTKMQQDVEACTLLNNEQEALKAKLKSKTDELVKKMDELWLKTAEARKIIKLDIPQTEWKEFGITDKR